MAGPNRDISEIIFFQGRPFISTQYTQGFGYVNSVKMTAIDSPYSRASCILRLKSRFTKKIFTLLNPVTDKHITTMKQFFAEQFASIFLFRFDFCKR